MTKRGRSVAVIGLGPAGLATVKELKSAGCFDTVKGFDRCRRVGGRWSLDRETHNAGVWEELCTNTSRRHMEFSDFPWDAGDGYDGADRAYEGIFPHCSEVLAYLEAYATEFDLYPDLQLGTEVTKIDKAESSGWKVTTVTNSKITNGVDDSSTTTTTTTTTCHAFDAIVICNGPQAKAFHPIQSKLQNFTGEVIHSENFQSAKDFKGQRVLVIGGSISGSEIVSLLAENGIQTSHSMRKMPYHIQKFTKNNNTSMDDNIYIRLAVWMDRITPDALVAMGLKLMILFHWPEQCTRAAMPNCSVGVSSDIRKCGVTVTKNYVDQVGEGVFDVKPEVATVEGKRITFADDTFAEFDAIISATGYDFDVSFLPESVREEVRVLHPGTGKHVLALYKNTLVPNPDLVGNLAFCGVINSLGPYFPQAEVQARYIAAIWSGRVPRPGLSALRRNAAASVEKKLDTSSILNKFDTATIVTEDIGEELGITPGIWKALWSPRKYLLGPVYACFYRTNKNAPDCDEEIAKKCQQRFDSLIASSPQSRPHTIDQGLSVSEEEALLLSIVAC